MHTALITGRGIERERSLLIFGLLLGCHSLDIVPSPPTSPLVALKLLGNRVFNGL